MFNFILIFFSSTLMGISQHPLGMGFLSLISLIPIFPLLINLKEYKYAIKIGLVWGIIFNITSVYWIAFNIGTSPTIAFTTMLLSVLILTSGPILICLTWCMLNRRGVNLIFLSFIWPSVELIRSYGSLAFPWISLSNSLTDYNLIIQNAEYIGIYGITFWIVITNIFIYRLILNRNKISLLLAISIIVFPQLTGKFIKDSNTIDKNESIRVASIQPNIHLSEKWEQGAQNNILTKILSQSSIELNADKNINPDLFVWPETSTISYLLTKEGKYNYNRVKKLLANTDTKLIAGIPHYEYKDKKRHHYNSIGYFNSSGLIDIYHKINLVPGAEYVPLSGYINSLDILNIGLGNFTHGDEFTLFDIKSYKLGAMICFESTFPSLSREFVEKGANMLIYVVNDGWYETAPEPQQHARRSIYRAIETRRPVVRCANTGISMVIDQLGNIQHSIELNRKGTILADIYPSNKITFYVKYGDIFIYFMIAAIILLMFKSIKHEEYI